MFGNVTALVGLHVTGKYRDKKHAAHMLKACGLGSSHITSTARREDAPLAFLI